MAPSAAALAAVLTMALLSGCGGGPDAPPGPGSAQSAPEAPEAEDAARSRPAAATEPQPAAGGGASGEAASAAEYLAEPWLADADLGRGELLAYACRACHALDAAETNPLGPNLANVFGRPAGITDFDYSEPLREADFVWTPRALDAWLAQPDRFIPGNKMAFTGYRSETDRRDLIAWLLRETSRDAP